MPELYSIKNLTVTTIENCEQEPIHIPGTIQPHGFVLVTDATNTITHCSENISHFLGNSPASVLSKNCTEALPAAFAEVIHAHKSLDKKESRVPYTVTYNDKKFDCFFRSSGHACIMECIVSEDHPYSVYNVLEHTNELVQMVNRNIDLKTLCQLITKKIHDITGYDRVMVYRFDEMYNGEVFAETVVSGHEPFLGLHYPHTDIPPQARELYIKNLMRIIVDVDYTPVPVVTLDRSLAAPDAVDMSNTLLRSVSPIHIRYLKNMGVNATFTISLLKEGKLWGLIACHHYSAKNLSYTRQIQAFLQTQMLSSQLAVQETAEKYQLASQLVRPLKQLNNRLAKDGNFTKLYFENMPEILEIARATGAVLIGRDRIYRLGITPDEAQIKALNQWLAGKKTDEYHTHELAVEYAGGKELEDIASGLLYFNIVTSENNLSLLFFRPSMNKVIHWAGEPQTKEGIAMLTPRSSFAGWQQLIKGKSEPWEEAVIDTVFQFTYSLQQHLFRVYLRDEEIRIKQLNDQLVKANKELENINWISTHDLKEPLRKIQMFASILDRPEKMDAELMKLSIVKIRNAATRMQKLTDDLLVYSKMSSTYSNFEVVELNKVLDEVKKSFEDEYNDGLYTLTYNSLPSISGNFFQIKQLFTNLIGNSIKFRKKESPQSISIKAENNGDGHYIITYSDTGNGFSPDMNQKIFNIFQRGHNNPEIQGNGMGLSICKKIMENHGGEISAHGEDGVGASFNLLFPAE